MKRPRGLWKSQRSSGNPSPSELRPEDGTPPDEDADEDKPTTKRLKRDDPHDLLIDDPSQRRAQRSATDIEDWDDLKELFADVVEKYEGDELTEAVELLRGVIHECNRLLRLYPDPSVLFMPESPPRTSSGSPGRLSPPALGLRRSWIDERASPGPSTTDRLFTDRPTAFHYVYGTALFLLGKILSADLSLAKEGEPAGSPAFYLAALDVFELGENLPKRCEEPGSPREDWRMAIVWGRTLVCLADEKLRRIEHNTRHSTPNLRRNPSRITNVLSLGPRQPSPPLVDFQDPVWPRDSAFATASYQRPPVTRRISLPGSTPHEILLQATDQFSRGMLHMPNARRPRSSRHHYHALAHSRVGAADGHHHYHHFHHPTALLAAATAAATIAEDDLLEVDAPPTLPGLGAAETRDATVVRPRVLYTLASDVLSVAERLPDVGERETWASWADGVFRQMEMEADVRAWVYATAVGRGRCWLVIGAARTEALEAALEQSEGGSEEGGKTNPVLLSTGATEAREALHKAMEHFERSRAIVQQPDVSPQQDPYAVDLPPLIGEVLVTMAALTIDEQEKARLFERAAAEGVNVNDSDDSDDRQDTDMTDD